MASWPASDSSKPEGGDGESDLYVGAIARLEIYWPASDTTQQFQKVTVNQMIRIREGVDEVEVVKLPRFRFSSE